MSIPAPLSPSLLSELLAYIENLPPHAPPTSISGNFRTPDSCFSEKGVTMAEALTHRFERLESEESWWVIEHYLNRFPGNFIRLSAIDSKKDNVRTVNVFTGQIERDDIVSGGTKNMALSDALMYGLSSASWRLISMLDNRPITFENKHALVRECLGESFAAYVVNLQMNQSIPRPPPSRSPTPRL